MKIVFLSCLAATACLLAAPTLAQNAKPASHEATTANGASSSQLHTGQAAFISSWKQEQPGTRRKITLADLPQPYATKSVNNHADVVPRPDNVWPKTLPGFKIELYAGGLHNPRKLLTAPNGDLFVAESVAGDIRVFRGIDKNGKPEKSEVFASGLHYPYGIAFYPPGPNPKWVYIGNTGSVVRFPYRNGDMKARGEAETIVPELPTGGHSTRDIVFSKDGKTMFVAVGSHSNHDDPDTHPAEKHRANVLAFTPEGKDLRVYASGIRNPAGMALNPTTGQLWVSVNERDTLGNNLVPDYITHVQKGGFYGWPWFYMGGHWDPTLKGKHPELKNKVITPDVLIQPHSASLGLTFYEGHRFPEKYRGDIFAAEHGSWNRDPRAGYEVILVPLKNGRASGVYEDFVTGFVLPNGKVWGRPVGVAVAKDGSLMVSDDASNSIWRVVYVGK
jgi:glucose/arabinose dehydrogenase